ncbi:uncharacterized protein GIQ15_03834 [Arthroderma uncinatum]|uniref:uncharacterized protein n=1 Tax=Arthroderma uncinatum TaxID=74035 RepID=UPI00144AD3D8|nr:uncharacterized protein GIQ15_03834 [Arthroderma uncinatum]KAF3481075.1 hypothetical protein GIQ15_03834 [Arthroderma uncinatum]
MSGLRRFHIKSRHGCGQCKKRRVKCDEQPPRCGGCSKRGLKCDYEETPAESMSCPRGEGKSLSLVNSGAKDITFEFHPLTELVNKRRTVNHFPDEFTQRRKREDILQANTHRIGELVMKPKASLSLDYQDLELLHHYRTITSHTLSEDKLKGQIWQFFVPELAQIYPFVMHNILSMAAMHLAFLQPESSVKYTHLAVSHQSHVIKAAQARVASQEVNKENCSAVVICSGLLLIYELAILHPSYFVGARTTTTALDEIIQKMLIMRRLVGLWTLSMPLFKDGPARSLLARGEAELATPLADEIRRSLDSIQMANNTLTADKEERYAYQMAVESLWFCFQICTLSSPADWVMGMAWPNMAPQRFMTALVEKKPLALATVAHYCALLYLYPGSWWMQGWPQPVLSSLIRAAAVGSHGPTWQSLFSWPSRVIGISQVEGCQNKEGDIL